MQCVDGLGFNQKPQKTKGRPNRHKSVRKHFQSKSYWKLKKKLAQKLSSTIVTDVDAVDAPVDRATDDILCLTAYQPTFSEQVTAPATSEQNDSLSILQEVQEGLPPHWCAVEIDEGLHITLSSKDLARVVQRSVFVTFSGNVQVFAHGQELPARNRTISASSASETLFVENVLNLVKQIRLLEICVGANNPMFKGWWKSCLDTCHIDNNSFHESRYCTTLRSNECEYLVDQPKKFCRNCHKFLEKFRKRKSPVKSKKTPNKFKAFKHLSSAEKEARGKRKSKDLRNLQRKYVRLTQQLDSLIVSKGRNINSSMDDTLGKSLEMCLHELQAKNSEDSKDKFLEIFIAQQLAARNAKGNHGIKWHPLMIRFALQLKHCAQASVNATRNFIRLPSDRLLWDYTHIYDVNPGVQQEFINDVAEKVHNMKFKYQHYHVLSFDEVSCKEGLVQRKQSGEMIGYAKLNEVQTELHDLRLTLEAGAENHPILPSTPPIAKKILTFMVRGTSSNIQSCVASYPVHNLSKEDLYQNVWEVTSCLETSGIKVVAFVADGSAINRSFFPNAPLQ